MLTGLFATLFSFIGTLQASVLAETEIGGSVIWVIVGVLLIIALLIWIIKR